MSGVIATRVYTGYSCVRAGKKIPHKSLLITEKIAEVLCGRLSPLISNVVAYLLILLSSNISGDGRVIQRTLSKVLIINDNDFPSSRNTPTSSGASRDTRNPAPATTCAQASGCTLLYLYKIDVHFIGNVAWTFASGR